MATTGQGRRRTWRFRLDDTRALEVSAPPRATEKQVRRRGRVSLVLGTLAAALTLVAVAIADNTVADGDGVVPIHEGKPMAFGDVDCGVATSSNALIAIKKTGRPGNPTASTFGNGITVTISVLSVAGAGLSATVPAAPGNQIILPGDWTGPANNDLSAHIASQVTINSSVEGAGAGSVTYRASGLNNAATPTTITRDVTMAVSWTTGSCAPANTPPTAGAGGPYTGDEGEQVQLDGSGSFDPEDGDVASYSWTVLPASGSGNDPDAGAGCDFVDGTSNADAMPKVACTDDGVYDVTLTVEDSEGLSDTDTTTLTLNNVAPEITTFTCPTDPVAVGTQVALNGVFTDAGANDTHTASIAWGDSSSSAGTVVQGSGSGTVSGSHTYTAAGIYAPMLTVTDDDEDSATEKCEYVVVYDPSAGFVTGGGWIWSPEGAYMADPTMVGKATFGFVSKYKKGANVPDGNTEFQFHAAGLNFKSTSYQWLVVSGSKATFKGWGTINGSGSFGFLLSAIDGSPDKFRIKIWDVGSGDVVYDNNLAGGDDADPATALGGGSIVIHTGGKK